MFVDKVCKVPYLFLMYLNLFKCPERSFESFFPSLSGTLPCSFCQKSSGHTKIELNGAILRHHFLAIETANLNMGDRSTPGVYLGNYDGSLSLL